MCQCFLHLQLKGRREKVTIISQTTDLLLNAQMVLFFGKLVLLYQMTDTHTVSQQKNLPHALYHAVGPTLVYPHLRWKSTVHLSVTMLRVPVSERLAVVLKETRGIYLHNGPGVHSDLVNVSCPEILLSSFLAFVVVSTQFWFNTIELSASDIKYASRPVKPVEVFVTHNKSLSLPQCTNPARNKKQFLNKQQHTKDKAKTFQYGGDQHCVFKLFSKTGFVKLSISRLQYVGQDPSFGEQFMPATCSEGGVAIKEDTNNFKYLCTNASSNSNITDEDQSFITDFISSKSNELLLVVYSFKHYSHVLLEAGVSSTACQRVDATDGQFGAFLKKQVLSAIV